MITNGRSLGKILVGLRVVHQSGLPIDLRSSISRNVFRIIDMLPDNYVVGLVSMVLSASGERLGDHVAGTIVIRLDRLAPTVLFDDREARELLPLTREQQSRLGALEVQLIRTTLRRIDSLSVEQSDRVLVDVTETLCTRLEMPLPVGDRRTFLRALLDSSERYSRRG